jgi:hypothetical protein
MAHDAVEYLNGEREIGAARIEPTTTRPLADADGLDFVDVRGMPTPSKAWRSRPRFPHDMSSRTR